MIKTEKGYLGLEDMVKTILTPPPQKNNKKAIKNIKPKIKKVTIKN